MKNIAFRLAKFFFGIATWTRESDILRKFEENKRAEKKYYESIGVFSAEANRQNQQNKKDEKMHWSTIKVMCNGKEIDTPVGIGKIERKE